ncbi:MAG: methyltransferase [bacterium]
MIEVTIKGKRLMFQTNNTLFSPRYIDPGTLAMLSQVDFDVEELILDLGCGYGVVGIVAAKFIDPSRVYMIDIDAEATRLSEENARLNKVEGVHIIQSDGFKNLEATGFSLILCNPPYTVDFAVPKCFIKKGFNRLRIDGRFFMVTKRRLWYKNKFISTFGGVQIEQVDDYNVFCAIKKTEHYVNGLANPKHKKIISKKLRRKT